MKPNKAVQPQLRLVRKLRDLGGIDGPYVTRPKSARHTSLPLTCWAWHHYVLLVGSTSRFRMLY